MAKNQSTEDYLKGIYTLQGDGKAVTTSRLARHLAIGAGSVTGMLKKLASRKLIFYTPYKGVLLTGHGRELAVRMVRRHRLWEMFLVRYLGYDWHEIHQEAERLEHVTSDEMERRLDRALGYPKFDPHGDPIPSKTGEVALIGSTALAECSPGDRVAIVRVADDTELLRHLTSVGLALHRTIAVKSKLAVDGSMTVAAGRRKVFLSGTVAGSIYVARSDNGRGKRHP